MAVNFEQFVQGLELSGIISPSNLRAVCEKLPPDRRDDAQELARELVRQMSGNVWEWCWDSYGEYPNTTISDPDTGPGAAGSRRVLRGGAYGNLASYCRCADRFGSVPSNGVENGFRVARTIDAKDKVPSPTAASSGSTTPAKE